MAKQHHTKMKSGTFSKGSKSGKKWKKGQSCVTNPTFNQFRLAAKKNGGNFLNAGAKGSSSNLTVDAVNKHTSEHFNNDLDDMDSGSIRDGRSVASSYMSNCTNVTFSKVIGRFGMSSSAAHKEILAMLEGAAEVIKAQGEEDTDTSYFALLLNLLKSDNLTDEGQCTPALYLLSLCIKRVPAATLKSRFSDFAKVILDVFQNKIKPENQSTMRSALVCLSHLLRVQDQSAWSVEETRHVYNSILHCVDYDKSKVRHAARQAIGAVLRGSTFMNGDNAPLYHPASPDTAKYCIKKLEFSANVILDLLAEVMSVFPKSYLKSSCEAILRLMTLSDTEVKKKAMITLKIMFSMQPKDEILSAELNAQIISALFEYRPAERDGDAVEQWLPVMQQAYANLVRLDENLFIANLTRLFEACMKYMQTQPNLASRANETMIFTLRLCTKSLVSSVKGDSISKLVRKVEHGLGYQYAPVWSEILSLVAIMFEVFGKSCKQFLKPLSDMRTDEFEHKHLVDKAVGAAVKTMGPKAVLEVLPLNITGDNDDINFPRSWLMPVFRDHVQETELAFFADYFLPLAQKIHEKCKSYEKLNKKVELKAYQAFYSQIWSMLPGFCTRPTDLVQSFSKIAQILGKTIVSNNEARMDVLCSLRKLINENLENEPERAVLDRYSKNFISTFCNFYTTVSADEQIETRDPHKLAMLETLKCYLKICRQILIQQKSSDGRVKLEVYTEGAVLTKDMKLTTTVDFNVEQCLEFLNKPEVPIRKMLGIEEVPKNVLHNYTHLLMDLIIAFVLYVNIANLDAILQTAYKDLQKSDKTLQKKAYRILEEICSSKSDTTKSFVLQRLAELKNRLVDSLSSSNPSSKAPRLRCLISILKQLNDPQDEFLVSIVAEAVLCTRANGERARTAAYGLLVEMARSYIRWHTELQPEDALDTYVKFLTAGFAGNNHMIVCTFLALSKVLYEFKTLVKSNTLEAMVDFTCKHLRDKSREVVQAALGMVKCFLSAFGGMFGQFLKNVISSLVSMKEDNRHHFRFKSKEIYTRLIRKYGFALILEMVPASHHKILNHIRKEQERVKRKKNADDDESEDDDNVSDRRTTVNSIDEILQDTDSELEDDVQSMKSNKKVNKMSKKKKGGASYLKEDGEIIDFMDPSSTQKVFSSKPQTSKGENAAEKKEAFTLAHDGRIIIPSDVQEPKKKSADKQLAAEALELITEMDKMKQPSKRKRFLLENCDRNSDRVSEFDESASQMTYQAGGRGIHRPIGKKQKIEMEPGQEYRSKKGKGDVKRGQLEPYSYIELDPKLLNKRKKLKAKGVLKNVVRGAAKGGGRSQKQKKHHKKR